MAQSRPPEYAAPPWQFLPERKGHARWPVGDL